MHNYGRFSLKAKINYFIRFANFTLLFALVLNRCFFSRPL
jgi:hypothetical protein